MSLLFDHKFEILFYCEIMQAITDAYTLVVMKLLLHNCHMVFSIFFLAQDRSWWFWDFPVDCEAAAVMRDEIGG